MATEALLQELPACPALPVVHPARKCQRVLELVVNLGEPLRVVVLACPGYLHLPALVAKVSGDSHRIGEVVGAFHSGVSPVKPGDIPVAALPEKDIFDTVEPEESRAELLAGIHIPVFTAKSGDLGRVGKGLLQPGQVKRPGVYVRVDTEISGRAPEESLALLPVCTCGKEGLAGLVKVLLRSAGLQSLKVRDKLFGIIRQACVRRDYCVVHKSVSDSHESLVTGRKVIRIKTSTVTCSKAGQERSRCSEIN